MLIPAYAKLNLYLNIIDVKSNGYHNLNMIMQGISLHDKIEINFNHSGIINVDIAETSTIRDADKKMLKNETNLAYIMADEFCKKFKIDDGININITKNIPLQSGMGGGSADAATVLTALNYHFDTKMVYDDLVLMSQKFGADIPFCLKYGTAAVSGIGEKIRRLNHLPKMYVVIVKHFKGIATKEAFDYYDLNRKESMDNFNFSDVIDAFNCQDKIKFIPYMRNSLEKSALVLIPKIRTFKEEMEKTEALKTMITGSGSAIFSLFDDYNKAIEGFEVVKKYRNEAQVFFAETI